MSRVFMLLDFYKNLICDKGEFYPNCGAKRSHGWGKMPPSLTEQFALNLYSKIRVHADLA